MPCYRVQVPMGVRVAGAAADGEPTWVLPGEYLVHQLQSKVSTPRSGLLRFVGADPAGRDVHVALESLRTLPGSLGVSVLPVEGEAERGHPPHAQDGRFPLDVGPDAGSRRPLILPRSPGRRDDARRVHARPTSAPSSRP